jgi:hypothetical protein
MPQVLLSLAWRLAVLGAVAWWAWRTQDAFALVPLCLLVSLLIPNPLLNLIAELWHALRVAVWGPVEGRHFSYRGRSVRVIIDEDHRRWVNLRDVRKIIGFTASDGSLSIAYPDGFRLFGRRSAAHLCDEALLTHLRTEPGAEALKFRQWVERDIAFAARRQRERFGIRAANPASTRDDI